MATTGTLGRVDEFVSSRDDWPQYVERLEYFFVANGITDAGKKRVVILSVMGATTYKTLRNILSPVKPGEKTYAEFHSRVRKAGESVSAYLAELRSLSKHCNFGESLNDVLWDRLVCGTTVPYRRRSSPRLLSRLRQQQRSRSLRKLQPRVCGNSDSGHPGSRRLPG